MTRLYHGHFLHAQSAKKCPCSINDFQWRDTDNRSVNVTLFSLNQLLLVLQCLIWQPGDKIPRKNVWTMEYRKHFAGMIQQFLSVTKLSPMTEEAPSSARPGRPCGRSDIEMRAIYWLSDRDSQEIALLCRFLHSSRLS